ncbi:hypothetical protein A8C56_17890 [Niabella ginsenosidivorans]|uniref:Uncharacterized protein n=2 Tax=Niabella ginsenosidivorans TaxID=1176587 RepID=A0A1A9I4P1_9BACT|nr:hypothetical protein A8C56_17890 [Niabella ginsenosidivorans]
MLGSCGLNQKKAVDYNNSLVKIQQEAGLTIVNAENQINTAITGGDSAKAGRLMRETANFVRNAQKKLDSVKYEGEDFGMKAALAETLAFMNQVYAKDYQQWLRLQFAANPNPADLQKAQALMAGDHEKGTDLDKKFLSAQEQFAKNHNIRLIRQNLLK